MRGSAKMMCYPWTNASQTNSSCYVSSGGAPPGAWQSWQSRERDGSRRTDQGSHSQLVAPGSRDWRCFDFGRVIGTDQASVVVRQRSEGAVSLGGLVVRRTGHLPSRMRLTGAEEMQDFEEENLLGSVVVTFLPRCSEGTPAICLT